MAIFKIVVESGDEEGALEQVREEIKCWIEETNFSEGIVNIESTEVSDIISVEAMLDTELMVDILNKNNLDKVAQQIDVGEIIGLINQLGDNPIQVCYALLRIKATIDLMYNALTEEHSALKQELGAYKSSLMMLFGQKDNVNNPLVVKGIKPTVTSIDAAVLEEAGYQSREAKITKVTAAKQSLYSIREVINEELRLINALIGVMSSRGLEKAELISKDSLEEIVRNFEELQES